MRSNHFNSKKRQLQFLVRRLKFLIASQKEFSKAQIEKVVAKIQKLIHELAHVISRSELKKILGAAAIYIGVSFPFHATSQSFAEPQLNPFGITPSYYWAFPAFADMDGDGDTDLLVGAYYGSFNYYENIGSASDPEFAIPLVNPFGLDTAYYWALPALADLDGDGDTDLLVGAYYGAFIYYENEGTAASPQFAAAQVNPFGLDSNYLLATPQFVDLDGDGDLDLMVSEMVAIGEYEYSGKFQYFENTGTILNPEFAAPQENPFGLDSTFPPFGIFTFADLDEDGDVDMLIGLRIAGDAFMIYYENVGTASNPQFGQGQINPFGLTSTYYIAAPAFVDLDDDGDFDLLVGEYYGNMQYFENTSTTPVQTLSKSIEINVFPNPTSDVLTIQTQENITKIELFSALGQSMGEFEIHNNKINLEKLNPGMYHAKFYNENGDFTTKNILKQ